MKRDALDKCTLVLGSLVVVDRQAYGIPAKAREYLSIRSETNTSVNSRIRRLHLLNLRRRLAGLNRLTEGRSMAQQRFLPDVMQSS